MKKKLAIILIVLTSIPTVMAQKERKFKAIKLVRTSEPINVSADSLWKIVREFQNVGQWITNIDSSSGSGEPEFVGATCSERVCNIGGIKGYDTVSEKLYLHNENTREIAYEVLHGMPSFILYANNHWTVNELGSNQSTLTMDSNIHVKRFKGFFLGGMMKKNFSKNFEQAFEDLKVYAETGEVSEAKKARIKQLERKNQS